MKTSKTLSRLQPCLPKLNLLTSYLTPTFRFTQKSMKFETLLGKFLLWLCTPRENLHDIILAFWQSFESRVLHWLKWRKSEKFRFNEVSFTGSFIGAGMWVKKLFCAACLAASERNFSSSHIWGLLFSIARHCAVPFSFVIIMKLKLLMKSIESR